MRVLLVDDEEELVVTLAERLGLRGIEADWVTNCEAALETVKHKHFHVAVLDIKLPRMSGLTLKRKIESLAPDMKFIFMTGHGSKEDFEEGTAEAGDSYYLLKPVDIESLADKIREIV
ncbi:MAG: response regulator [Deltaproteobacteria bacterium]|nr:response regulator [Deltaproteobacteria bacterium]